MNPERPTAGSSLRALSLRSFSPGIGATLLAFWVALTVPGCAGTPPDDSGVPSGDVEGVELHDHFSLTAGRKSIFSNSSDAVTWHLVLDVDPVTAVVDGREIVTVHYSKEETSELVGSVQWSSTEDEGTWIHGFGTGEGDAMLFDPPVAVTDSGGVMTPGDVVETSTTTSDGVEHDYSSTFVRATDPCPFIAIDDLLPCVQFDIDDGDNSQLTGPLFAGSVEYVEGYGPIWMVIPGWESGWFVNEILFPES